MLIAIERIRDNDLSARITETAYIFRTHVICVEQYHIRDVVYWKIVMTDDNVIFIHDSSLPALISSLMGSQQTTE